MAFLSVTRLRIRAWRFLPGFVIDTQRALKQVRTAEGFIGGLLLADRHLAFWTMTLWQDQAAMRRYMTGGAHLKAMPKLLHWCDEASVVHWQQDDHALPGWDEADRRMRAEGRSSKVRHPADGHLGLAYAVPRTAGAVPIRRR